MCWGVLPSNLSSFWGPPPPVSQQDPAETKQQIHSELTTFAKLAQELKPSVVNISVVKQLPAGTRLTTPFPNQGLPEATGHGSGVIISSDGEILTNNHVVNGAKTITVKLSDGRELAAEVLGTDSNTDLALLKAFEGRDLPVARLGDSEAVSVGEWVMAIGNPFGLEATVTVGVLSGKGRVIGAGPYDDFLQTDASINPGNSGGPLFNTKGEVIGINTAIVPGGQGIGFSIPINLAREVANQLKKDGRVVRGFIGVGIQPLAPALKSALEIPLETEGALVASVLPGGPSAQAGLKVSDVIVAINNERIRTDRDLLRKVAELKIGSDVPFTVVRGNTEETVFITIVERPSPESAKLGTQEPSGPQLRVGVSVTDMLNTDEPRVVVTAVAPGSAASRANVRRGDIIRAVGANAVTTAHEFIAEVNKVDGDIALLVERQGRTTFLVIEENR